MKNLTTLFMTIAICSSGVVMASDSEEKSIDQMLGTLKTEKIQAEIMIEAMARRGKLNNDQVTHAKREIASVKEDDIETIKTEALDRLSSRNSFATK